MHAHDGQKTYSRKDFGITLAFWEAVRFFVCAVLRNIDSIEIQCFYGFTENSTSVKFLSF